MQRQDLLRRLIEITIVEVFTISENCNVSSRILSELLSEIQALFGRPLNVLDLMVNGSLLEHETAHYAEDLMIRILRIGLRPHNSWREAVASFDPCDIGSSASILFRDYEPLTDVPVTQQVIRLLFVEIMTTSHRSTTEQLMMYMLHVASLVCERRWSTIGLPQNPFTPSNMKRIDIWNSGSTVNKLFVKAFRKLNDCLPHTNSNSVQM